MRSPFPTSGGLEYFRLCPNSRRVFVRKSVQKAPMRRPECTVQFNKSRQFASDSQPRASSPALAEPGFEGEAAILVAHCVERGPRAHLVFELDHLTLRRSHVGSEGNENLASHPLLNCHARARTLLAAAQHRINREMRNAGQFFQPAGHLATDLRGN